MTCRHIPQGGQPSAVTTTNSLICREGFSLTAFQMATLSAQTVPPKLAFSMLLFEIGRRDLGQAVKSSVLQTLRNGARTRDLGGDLSTTQFSEAVASELAGNLAVAVQTE